MVFITKAAAALIALLATSTEALWPAVTPTMSSAGPKTPGRRDFLRLGSAVAIGTLAGSAPANAVKELCKSRAGARLTRSHARFVRFGSSAIARPARARTSCNARD